MKRKSFLNVKTGQDAHLSDPEGAVGIYDTYSTLSACIAFQDWRDLAKPVLILAGEISSTDVIDVY